MRISLARSRLPGRHLNQQTLVQLPMFADGEAGCGSSATHLAGIVGIVVAAIVDVLSLVYRNPCTGHRARTQVKPRLRHLQSINGTISDCRATWRRYNVQLMEMRLTVLLWIWTIALTVCFQTTTGKEAAWIQLEGCTMLIWVAPACQGISVWSALETLLAHAALHPWFEARLCCPPLSVYDRGGVKAG
jgi:hypothetical protein